MFSTETYHRKLSDYFYHPKYKDNLGNITTSQFDIGIIRVDKPFELGKTTGIYPACLPNYNMLFDKNLIPGDLFSSGFGFMNNKANSKQDGFSGVGSLDLKTNNFRLQNNSNICRFKRIICAKNSQTSNCIGDSGKSR